MERAIMKKKRICVVTGNRAEYSRAKTAMKAIEEHPDMELILIVTGAHLLDKYGATFQEIEADGFNINEKVYLIVEGENPITMTKSVGLGIIELATIFNNYKPDIVIAPTDRFETLSVAISSALMNIVLAHIQGGEVTGTIDESIRHAITKFAHIHFAATEKSRERIIKMGEDAKFVFNVGCPAIDLLLKVDSGTKKELFNRKELIPKDGRSLDPESPFLLVVQHPVTTEFEDSFRQIQETLYAIEALKLQTIMLWPNADAGSDEIVKGVRRFLLNHDMKNLFLYKHFPTDTFVKLMMHCSAMMGNSSSGIRETCYLGTPVVNIGTRQQDRERGRNVVNVSYNREEITDVIKRQIQAGKYPKDYLYGDGSAGEKIAEILAGCEVKSVQKKIQY